MVDRLAAEMDLGFGAVPLDVLVLRMIAAIVLGGIIGSNGKSVARMPGSGRICLSHSPRVCFS